MRMSVSFYVLHENIGEVVFVLVEFFRRWDGWLLAKLLLNELYDTNILMNGAKKYWNIQF